MELLLGETNAAFGTITSVKNSSHDLFLYDYNAIKFKQHLVCCFCWFGLFCFPFQGNKGGVSVRLEIHGVSVCFVNCHFAAHDHAITQRISVSFHSIHFLRLIFASYLCIIWFEPLGLWSEFRKVLVIIHMQSLLYHWLHCCPFYELVSMNLLKLFES